VSENTQIQLEQANKWGRKIVTCVIGGSCSDGVVIVGDSKITFERQPPTYGSKMNLDFYPIVTAYAGSSILYNEFRSKAFDACQARLPLTSGNSSAPAVSGAFCMYYSTTNNSIKFPQYETDIQSIITQINSTQSAQVGNKFEVFIAAQLQDKSAKLVHYMYNRIPDDIEKRYKSMGGGEQYSYVFLHPLYKPEMSMKSFARLGYFIIKYLARFELSMDIGGPPHFCCVPDIGQIIIDEQKWISEFESDTNKMLDNYETRGIDALLPYDPTVNMLNQGPLS
jgi:hypothetical protein